MNSFVRANLHTRVKLFKSSLQTLFVLGRVEDEANKLQVLLGALGPELGALVEVRCAPRVPAQLRYEELLALLEREPASPEEMMARVRLYSARRALGEPLRAWAKRLQALAASAYLGPKQRAVLRDVFIAGLGPTPLQEILCRHGLDLHGDLDDALQVALQLEDGDHNDINKPESDDELTAVASEPKASKNILKVQDGTVAVAALGGTVHISGDIKTKTIIKKRGKAAINPLPYELRQRLSTFCGRDEYLQQLTETLDRPDGTIAVVHGLSGVGKSELCNQYAWRHIHRYNHNVIWVKCETAAHLEAQFCTLARDLDINTRSTEWVQPSDRSITQITDIYSWLKDEGACLLVLDDVLTRSHVNKYLPGEQFKNIRVLITSPNGDWEGVRTIKLKSLTTDECQDILKTVASTHFDFETQNNDFDKLFKIVEGNPLAVQICGSYILHECRPANSNFKLKTYVNALEHEKDIIEETLSISSEHQYKKSIYICFETTLTKIKEIAKEYTLSDILKILYFCAYLNVEATSRSLLQEICQTEDFSAAIRVLDEFSLVYSDEDEQVRMHKLIQKAVIRHQEKSKIDSEWFQKVLIYFLTCNLHYEVQLASVLRHAQRYKQVILDLFQNQLYTSKLITLLVSFDCDTNVKGIFERINDSEKIMKVVRDNNLVHVAVRCNKRQMVGYLLNHENEVDRLDDKGQSPLMVAAFRGLNDVTELLISRGAQVDKTGPNGDTPLHLAARAGHAPMCELLLDNNSSDAIQNSDGYYPIHVAANHEQLEVIGVLVGKNPTSVFSTDRNNNIPFHIPALGGHVQVLRYFLDKHKVAVDTLGRGGCTALMAAAQEGHIEAVRWLLERGASHLTWHMFKASALHLACSYGHADIAALLITKGSEMNAPDKNGDTPFQYAAAMGQLDVVKVLINAKAEINLQNEDGVIPLHQVAYKGHLDVVRELCAAGARGDVSDHKGYTPLSYASRQGHTAVCAFLREWFPEIKERR